MRVADGETVVIAGLISRDETSTSRKMPILGDLPLVGWLFRSDSYNNSENEIIIMVTPHITAAVALALGSATALVIGLVALICAGRGMRAEEFGIVVLLLAAMLLTIVSGRPGAST